MRTRAERRYLTQCYQNRQLKLYNTFFGEWGEMTPQRKGTYKTRSWKDCGKAHCQMCCSPRKSSWVSKEEGLTLAERRAVLSHKDGIEEAGF